MELITYREGRGFTQIKITQFLDCIYKEKTQSALRVCNKPIPRLRPGFLEKLIFVARPKDEQGFAGEG